MTVYLDLIVLLNFVVDLLLLLGTNRLCGCATGFLRCAAAALLGGLYGGACLIPGFSFLGSLIWRIVSLALMCGIAFGFQRSALRRGVVFIVLTMALGGIALGMGNGSFGSLVAAAAGLFLMCALGFARQVQGGRKVTVMLRKGSVSRKLTALVDTGNTLRDPVSGEQILVVDNRIAWEMMGLSPEQLMTPVETMAAYPLPGLRLIPYRSVGCSAGMLLAVRMDEVWIDGQKAGTLVAFAPQEIGASDTYQALAGGMV